MSQKISLQEKNTPLWQNYQDKKGNDRMLFPTEGANLLGVSELELLLASPNSQYMGTDCKAVLLQLEEFGVVESIVRNALAVHEKSGLYHNLKLGEKMGLALNVGGLDLRFFMWQWKHMIAMTDTSNAERPSYSVQFFDGSGHAIDKVFLRELSAENINKWQQMIAEQCQEVQSLDSIELEPKTKPTAWQYKALEDEKRQELQSQWQQMTDVHQFHFLLKKLEIDRASSYYQAPEGMATPLKKEAFASLFEQARDAQCSIMIFVGNTGMVQIQTGQVHQLKRIGDWYNILDKKDTQFTLHLKDQDLAQVWCVKRPTKDGIVTCIEGFDQYGTSILTVFGERIEGEPEQAIWQEITQSLVSQFQLSDNSQNVQ
ncbi:ChuX/HutX family heme-like substrate-binding protein [Psychrobacter sp. I-STPA6b]|uniref:ChuX/HutX family heme-like substrate-binding protein n=1 Tax=Psychrobacter sp. I-STPA6b TaxID=2585718 RepID=UPI001D0C4CAF|nr:ChuX/HutX family heme-like substrate-binding protein [Psychrobacter sp. I-STPA6b]